jgi:proteic killer suppression protein
MLCVNKERGVLSSWEDFGKYNPNGKEVFPVDNSKQIVYYCTVIQSFRCRETRKIFHRQFSRKFPHDIQQRAFMKLNAIDAATELEDLGLPSSNRLEALKGERKGQWSIRINDQWRICFEWRDGNAEQVEIVDYH